MLCPKGRSLTKLQFRHYFFICTKFAYQISPWCLHCGEFDGRSRVADAEEKLVWLTGTRKLGGGRNEKTRWRIGTRKTATMETFKSSSPHGCARTRSNEI